jgi:hypothetical protein
LNLKIDSRPIEILDKRVYRRIGKALKNIDFNVQQDKPVS